MDCITGAVLALSEAKNGAKPPVSTMTEMMVERDMIDG